MDRKSLWPVRRDKAGRGDLAGQSWTGWKTKQKQTSVLSAYTVGQGLRLELDPTLLRKPPLASVPCRGRRDRKRREGKKLAHVPHSTQDSHCS